MGTAAAGAGLSFCTGDHPYYRRRGWIFWWTGCIFLKWKTNLFFATGK